MSNGTDPFRVLVDRVSKGDRRAEIELLRELEAPVARVVRRVLQGGMQPPALAQWVRAEVTRLEHIGPRDVYLADQVARNLCASLVEQMRGEPDSWVSLRDTLLS